MRPIYDNAGYNEIEDFRFYYNIDARPLFTPIVFYNQDKSCYIKYEQYFRPIYHKSYNNIVDKMLSNRNRLEQFQVRDKSYIVGPGTVFKYLRDENQIDVLTPIMIFCFDETTDWENETGYKIVVNSKEWNDVYNKGLKPKLSKIIDNYVDNYNSDVIFTSSPEKYCFTQAPNLKFSSIKEQREWLDKLPKKINGNVKVDEEELVF